MSSSDYITNELLQRAKREWETYGFTASMKSKNVWVSKEEQYVPSEKGWLVFLYQTPKIYNHTRVVLCSGDNIFSFSVNSDKSPDPIKQTPIFKNTLRIDAKNYAITGEGYSPNFQPFELSFFQIYPVLL